MDNLLDKIDISSLPGYVTTLLFIYFAIVRDLDKRLNGLSAYIKRFLALYRATLKARQEGTRALLKLSEELAVCNNRAKSPLTPDSGKTTP